MLADTLKSMLDQVVGIKAVGDSGEQTEAVVAQLKSQLASTLQPVLNVAQPPGNNYGPAATPGHAVRQEVAPYQAQDAQKDGREPGAAAAASAEG